VNASEELPAHCRVDGVIGSGIRFQLLLPKEWNGKLVMGGGGGFVGRVQNQAQDDFTFGGSPLARGYATVGTDTGHSGHMLDASWAFENLERKINFGHRAVHLTAEAAKSLASSFYGEPPKRSYFLGCSRGGGQGMMESQLYPNDFDGIVSGAPAFHWSGIMAGFLDTQQKVYPEGPEGAPVLTADNRKLLETTILERCDSLDRVEDGVMDDPRRCDFQVSDLPACPGDVAGPDCVTRAQRAAIAAIYSGPMRGGERLFFGFPLGGENDRGGWMPWIVGGPEPVAPGAPSLHYGFGTQAFKYLFADDPGFDYRKYDFESFEEDTRFGASILNATNTDLGPFREFGGKLLMWHGWSDAALTALATIDYYEKVAARDSEVSDYFRLFLMPGVLHCAGGPGPDQVDWLGAIDDWVERGVPPERIVASRLDEGGNVTRARPLCPYPQVAIYDGRGSPDEDESFRCE
jgi:feruloyl esterase